MRSRRRRVAARSHVGPLLMAMVGLVSSLVIPSTKLPYGLGRHTKPFKMEWATEKDGLLYLGSIGKEWVVNGVRDALQQAGIHLIDVKSLLQETIHHNCVWVKTIDQCGRIKSHDWYSLFVLGKFNVVC